MSNEMIDKVAKAIYDRSLDDDQLADFGLPRADAVTMAIAAIQAMRELPDSIKKAEGIYCNCNTCGGHEEGWQKIIDKILES